MFVTNWISTTKIQKISEITNFFRHYFLSRTEVETEDIKDVLPETLVVGDMNFDVDMAHHAGCKACAVTYGNGTREQLASAEFIIDDFAELLGLV